MLQRGGFLAIIVLPINLCNNAFLSSLQMHLKRFVIANSFCILKNAKTQAQAIANLSDSLKHLLWKHMVPLVVRARKEPSPGQMGLVIGVTH
jgi:hypothetical protein